MRPAEPADRVARIEAHLAIQQLAIRYAIGIDSRDLDLLTAQWVPDVWMGKAYGRGRDAVRAYFTPIRRGFYRAMHMIVGHRIDIRRRGQRHGGGLLPRRARVRCRLGRPGRRGPRRLPARGRQGWGFARRRHHHWYSTPVEDAPAGPTFEKWPGRPGPLPDAPHHWPTWERF